MTILYRPVKIESAEQADALPEETIAYLLHDDGFTDGVAMRLTQTSDDPRAWQVMNQFALNTHARMVGWTALVPIEAEEEWGVACRCGVEGCIAEGAPEEHATHRHYFTPWEDAR